MDIEQTGEGQKEQTSELPRRPLAPGDLVRWNGMVAEVVDVALLAADHEQVVLRRLDRRAALISLPVDDLSGAELWHFAGKLA